MSHDTKPQWYYSGDGGEIFYPGGETREAAIAEGRNDYDDGRPLEIAFGGPKAVWDELFSDPDSLLEYIDDHNEDASFEDAWSAEAGIGTKDVADLCEQINGLWRAWLAEKKPYGRALTLSRNDAVPATPEWLSEQEKSDVA